MALRHKEIARLKISGKEVSNRKIADLLGMSRNKVNEDVREILDSGYSFVDVAEMSHDELVEVFGKKKENCSSEYEIPNFKDMISDLASGRVTRQILWEEYVDHCRLNGKLAYQRTQFYEKLNQYLKNNDFKDVLQHRAGEQIQVDWAGMRPHWFDPDTGEVVYGWLFGGILPFSGYSFVRITADMKMDSWIDCHVRMFEYFGGTSKILTPDNLKTGVTKHTKDELIINRTYQDMAEHYGMVVIPGRVRMPGDKNQVENLMARMEQNIIGRLRNHQFFSIEEYNEAAMIELERFNNKPFQKKEGSRKQLFEEYEKETLQPLPPYRYETAVYKSAKVQNNSHIAYGKNYYSVPYQYIGQEVELKITAYKITILYKHMVICEHNLELVHIGQYITEAAHMPPNSNAYHEWNSSRYLNWAKTKGDNVYEVVYRLFQNTDVEQKQYRAVHSLLKLADIYSAERLDHACQYALSISTLPRYRDIKNILKSSADLCQEDTEDEEERVTTFTRGGDYFG